MRTSAVSWRLLAVAALTAATLSTGGADAAGVPGPTPDSACGKGSLPEKVQGQAPTADVASGRFAKGYTCNVAQISHLGASGGYRVERYVDKAGHECAYWDSTLLFPSSIPDEKTEGPGVYVMDMSDPAHPKHVDTLVTPAMLSPHESLRLNQKRGLLVADMATPATEPGFVDVYDVTKDCRHPALQASSPVGVLGHEGGFSPDGKTFWVASLYAHTLAAVDLTNPRVPSLLWLSYDYQSHGVSLSNDGKTLYMAEAGYNDSDFHGLTVLDVSQVQKRMPSPKVSVISRLTWPNVSTPQNATPFVSKGHQYLLETDEFGSDATIGAARGQPAEDPAEHPGRPRQRPGVPGLPGSLLLAALAHRPHRHRLQLHHERPAGLRHRRCRAPAGDRLLQQADRPRLGRQPAEASRCVRDVRPGLRREDRRRLVHRRQQRLLRRAPHRHRPPRPLRPYDGPPRQLERGAAARGRDIAPGEPKKGRIATPGGQLEASGLPGEPGRVAPRGEPEGEVHREQ
jgi:hypothetical protein